MKNKKKSWIVFSFVWKLWKLWKCSWFVEKLCNNLTHRHHWTGNSLRWSVWPFRCFRHGHWIRAVTLLWFSKCAHFDRIHQMWWLFHEITHQCWLSPIDVHSWNEKKPGTMRVRISAWRRLRGSPLGLGSKFIDISKSQRSKGGLDLNQNLQCLHIGHFVQWPNFHRSITASRIQIVCVLSEYQRRHNISMASKCLQMFQCIGTPNLNVCAHISHGLYATNEKKKHRNWLEITRIRWKIVNFWRKHFVSHFH